MSDFTKTFDSFADFARDPLAFLRGRFSSLLRHSIENGIDHGVSKLGDLIAAKALEGMQEGAFSRQEQERFDRQRVLFKQFLDRVSGELSDLLLKKFDEALDTDLRGHPVAHAGDISRTYPRHDWDVNAHVDVFRLNVNVDPQRLMDLNPDPSLIFKGTEWNPRVGLEFNNGRITIEAQGEVDMLMWGRGAGRTEFSGSIMIRIDLNGPP